MPRITRTEEQIVIKVIMATLLAGHRITVCDQDAILVTNSLDSAQIMAAVADTDECAFDIIRHDGYSIGLIYFVFGNKGRQNVITDYTTTVEDLLASAGVPATQFTEV
jgi:hypothetical protein